MKIITPKVEPHDLSHPIIFLAGPVRGGGDWQYEMCQLLNNAIDGEFLVAIPSRYADDHPLSRKFVRGRRDVYPRQLAWERAFLKRAGLERRRKGSVIFWLAEQREERAVEDGPYAQDTYGELGEWRGHLHYRPKETRLVIGAESGFHGLSQIQRNFDDLTGGEYPIHETMEDVVAAAVKHL